jgi:hypothetical protein
MVIWVGHGEIRRLEIRLSMRKDAGEADRLKGSRPSGRF